MSSSDRVRVGILGATGYSGIEAVRLLAGHPFVELTVLTSEHYAGREVADVYRHLAGVDLPPLEELRADLIKGRAEVVLSCLPEKVGTPITAELVQGGVKVVDLSADYRLKDLAVYRATYGVEHPAPALVNEAVYGLSEFHRQELRVARLVATPGCFPTGSLLALLPLIKRDLIEPSSIVIDAKSGTTGARHNSISSSRRSTRISAPTRSATIGILPKSSRRSGTCSDARCRCCSCRICSRSRAGS